MINASSELELELTFDSVYKPEFGQLCLMLELAEPECRFVMCDLNGGKDMK